MYLRISSDPEGQRAGVERQRADCEALAARNGWEVVEVFEDNDVSAYSGKERPAFERLIAGAQAGDFDVVLVWASDRLYRRMVDLVRITSDLAPHVRIATVKGGDVDLESAEGILRAQVLGSVAEFESRRKAERIAARARQRAEQGHATASVRPFGWQWADPCPGGAECSHATVCDPAQGRRPRQGSRRGLEPHPVESAWLIEVYQRILDGDTLRAATRWLREQGATGTTGKPLESTALKSALLMPRNAGLVAHRDQIVADSADGVALVDRATWERVRTILTDPARRTSPEAKTSTPLGGGLLTCGKCGGPMSASNRHYPNGSIAPVYVCSRHQHLTRRRTLLDAPILDLARGLLVTMEESGVLAVATSPDPAVEPLRAEMRAAEDRLATLAAMVADGALGPADYAMAARRLRDSIGEMSARLARQEGRPSSARLLAAEGGVGAAFDALVAQAQQGTPDALRAVLREVFASVTVEEPAVSGHPTSHDVTVRWADWVPAAAPTKPVIDAGPIRMAQAERRAQVARLRAEGLGISEIADRLGVHRATVRGDLRELTTAM